MIALQIESWAIIRSMCSRSSTPVRGRMRISTQVFRFYRPSSWLPCSTTSKSGACVYTSLVTQTHTCTHILTHHSLAVAVSPGLLGIHHFLAWEFKIWVAVLCVAWPWAIRPCFRHSVPLLTDSEKGRKDYLLGVRELYEVPRLLISHLNFFACLKTKTCFLGEGWQAYGSVAPCFGNKWTCASIRWGVHYSRVLQNELNPEWMIHFDWCVQ